MSAADDAERARKFSEVATRIDWEVLAHLNALHPEQGFGGCVAEDEGQLCCVDFLLADYRKALKESPAAANAVAAARPTGAVGQ